MLSQFTIKFDYRHFKNNVFTKLNLINIYWLLVLQKKNRLTIKAYSNIPKNAKLCL